jgi:hypothetical protein
MDCHHFDALIRPLGTASRRSLVHAFASGLVACSSWALGISSVDAKNKHGKNKNKKRKKNKTATSEPAITPSPPPPSDPVTTTDAACDLLWWGALAGDRRYAQTFRALRSGQLTSASFGLTYNEAGVSFELAVREIDPEGQPGYVLARTTIANVPATNVGVPPLDNIPVRTITGVFATPATVVVGQVYALTLTGTSRYSFTIQAASDNPCPDGTLFTDREADGAFHSQVPWDLAYSTFVTS